MKKTFTPGPWVVFEVGASIGVTTNTGDMADIAHLYDKDGRFLCSDRSREEVLATARLIAQAPALWGLARTVARGEQALRGTALDLLRAIDGKPDAGFTGQEQAKEMGETHTWRGPAANFINLPKAPYIPPDVAAALGAAFIGMREQGLSGTVACRMVRDVLGRYCDVTD